MVEQQKGARGRGVLSNRSGRYEAFTRHAFDDGWNGGGLNNIGECGSADIDGGPPPLATHLHNDKSRSIITYNKSPDVKFDRSINPYRGCEHGCVYCYARPTHTYLGHSAGLDFETEIYVKPDAARHLTWELAKPGYRPQPIALGTNTDPYQPVESKLKITRSILSVLDAHHHPVTITTKNAGLVRDLDILGSMAARKLAGVALSVTTLDRKLARSMEPRASSPGRRIDAISKAAGAGVPTVVLVAPIIPGLNDHEMEAILEQAAQAGAVAAGYILLRLPREVTDLFCEWLDGVQTNKSARVLRRLQGLRGGKLNSAKFNERMSGTGTEAGLLRHRFKVACKRLGLATVPPQLNTSAFTPPRRCDSTADKAQLSLF